MDYTYLQWLLDSLPDYIQVNFMRTPRAGENGETARNIYGTKSWRYSNWLAVVSMPRARRSKLDGITVMDDVPFHHYSTFDHFHDESWAKDYNIYRNDDGFLMANMVNISIDSAHLGLVMLRAYRAALWLMEQNATLELKDTGT